MRGSTRGRAKQHAPKAQTRSTRSTVALALLLFVGTLALYSPVRNYAFIVNYDDYDYVVRNPHVTAGVSWQTLLWSFTSIEQSNWHPLTWLSHALDCQLFGLDAGDHHVTSVVIHASSVVLLFFLLQRATGAVGRSFVAAALFGWHPFNVQSVAWVAERKNVLSTLLFFLTLAAYGWYVRRPRGMRLVVVVGVFALALASKPMAVSLPFALLLLDYWPLGRVTGWTKPQLSIPQQPPSQLLTEKWPFFVLSAASCLVTLWAQQAGGAIQPWQVFPFRVRLENAVYSYLIYACKTFWPFGFALYYPHPGTTLPLWKPTLAAVLLCAISAATWWQRSIQPHLLVGWLWFLGILVPVIGIVQVGDQAMADRYAYLPIIGLFVMVSWGIADLADRFRLSKAQRWAAVGITLAALSFLTFREISYWRNSETIWSRALQVSDGNRQVEKQLANALTLMGDTDEALPHLINAVRLDPEDTTAHASLALCYAARGQVQDAIREYEAVVKLTERADISPADRWSRFSAQLSLGFVYAEANDYDGALSNFRSARQFNPAEIDSTADRIRRSLAAAPSDGSFVELALLLQSQGSDKDASSLLEKATNDHPDYVECRKLLSYLAGNFGASSAITGRRR